MNTIEKKVARHYGDDELLTRILAGLEVAGADLNQLSPDDLAPVEEFHIGGRKATIHAVDKMSLTAGQRVLDIGCGIGGAARYIASRAGCAVTGIDLTAEYIEIAKTLTDMTGLDKHARFEVASALEMPFPDAGFDAAITLHVAMNIKDREGLYREIARVLKPDAVLCLFDVMKKGEEAIEFPVPWAESEATSHLASPEEMMEFLDQAGFDVLETGDRTDFALDFFKEVMSKAEDGPQPLGIHLVMGDSAAEKMKNVKLNIEQGRIAPVQMVAKRRST